MPSLLLLPRRPLSRTPLTTPFPLTTPPFLPRRTVPPASTFTTTARARAAAAERRPRSDPRIRLLRYHLMHPKTPRPLRFSRMRYLRHWTIHRAWLLFRRRAREREEGFLERQHQSMHAACEALRTLEPGDGAAGGSRLYRLAMEKKGVWGRGGVPIEYARAQVERPGREAWNHGWRR